MIKTIPLNKLIPSPRNVRRSTDEQADLQLKADIEARGLLQNLVVAPAKKPRGAFTVEAGGRRLRALNALVEDGKLEVSHEVPCLVIGGGAIAHEASLAENFHRLAMNPADECLAFGQLIEQGADVEGIARRFGLTARFVEGRLRLSGLAPTVFEALGSGEITLDVAKAYAATPDRERQAWVFEQLRGSYSAAHPDSIRRMMTHATAGAGDPRARLVGEEAYVAAGGRIERDLFSEEAGERWLDLPLLERLATEKMEMLAAEMAAEMGLAWVRPTLSSWIGYPATAGLRRIVPEHEPLTDEEEARIEVAHARILELNAIIDDEDVTDEERRQAEEKAEALEREITDLRDKPAILDGALKPKLGTFLLLGDDGVPRLDAVFYREPEPEEEADHHDFDSSEPRETGPTPAADQEEPEEPEERPQPLSRALIDELAIQRRDILAVYVAADPGLALDLAVFLMVDRDAVYSCERSGSSLMALPPTDPVFGFKTPGAPATVARAQAEETLDRSWMAGASRAERFDRFRELGEEARAAWLGHAVARTLEASANAAGARACAFHDHLATLLGTDVAKWWRPTGANYFDRVPKAVTLAAFEEVGGASFSGGFAKAKKAELSETAERIFAGQGAVPDDVRERAIAWVPEQMRFAPTAEPVAAADDRTAPWEDSGDSEAAAAEAQPASHEEPDPDDGSVPDEGSGADMDTQRSSPATEEAPTPPARQRRRRGRGRKADADTPPAILEEAA
ncbi:MAG TPA: ParB/RepB/Spo0J family partition protein [Allosphingosinicella sp.]|jgi:ParB family chromosome partitioning protein